MDERLKLNDKQQKLVEQMRDLLWKMYANNIYMVLDDNGYLWLFNEEHMEDYCFEEVIGDDGYDYPMRVCDLPQIEIGAIRVLSSHEKLGIKFKD